MSISPGRRVAFEVLMRVAGGAYASDLLAVRSEGLESRDAGLAAEIVFGVLRYRAQIDWLIAEACGKRRLDEEVRTALRMGIYQLRYLDRIPGHAAVGESVELVKRAKKGSAAGFVNAVLRKSGGRGPGTWRLGAALAERGAPDVGQAVSPANPTPDGPSWPSREVELSCPEWLLERWERKYGKEVAEGIARAALRAPEKYFRGERMQDIGSQAIVPLLGLEAGQTFLDLCAAPGNKTAQALEAGVRAVACDVHFHRLAPMGARGRGAGAGEARGWQAETPAPHGAAEGPERQSSARDERAACMRPLLEGVSLDLVVLDATHPLPFSRKFDRILVDAPCSGTGTLGRNPEIKWKLRPEDLPDLHKRQVAILRNALDALAPGGILVYSTCSLEPEENEQVIEAVFPGPWPPAPGPQVVPGPTLRRLPGRDPGDGFFAAVLESRVPAND